MDDLDLDELRAVAEAAEPGEWRTCAAHEAHPVSRSAVRSATDQWMPVPGPIAECDAAHIAAFDPPTVLALLDRLEEAETCVTLAVRAAERAGILIEWVHGVGGKVIGMTTGSVGTVDNA